jgi:hypothetical protein
MNENYLEKKIDMPLILNAISVFYNVPVDMLLGFADHKVKLKDEDEKTFKDYYNSLLKRNKE